MGTSEGRRRLPAASSSHFALLKGSRATDAGLATPPGSADFFLLGKAPPPDMKAAPLGAVGAGARI